MFTTPISPEYSLDALIYDPKICDSTVDLGHAVKMFNILGENVDDYVSLGYFGGNDPSIDPYCVCLEDFPKKIIWNTFFNHSYSFSTVFTKLRGYLISLV